MGQFSKTRWARFIMSFVVSVILMVVVTKVAKSALEKALAEGIDIDGIVADSSSVVEEAHVDIHEPLLVKDSKLLDHQIHILECLEHHQQTILHAETPNETTWFITNPRITCWWRCINTIKLFLRITHSIFSIVDCPPTFTMYEFDAVVNCARVIKVPRKDFSLDVQRITEVIEHEKPKIIFLTSNNPDGSVISDEVLLKILDLPILVVLYEAYIEFSGLDSKMGWVKKHGNLIVLRTFSKRADKLLWRAKQPYNVSVAAEVSACAALKNPVYLEKVKVALVQERERLFKLLKQVLFLNPYPSYSNFILCEVTNGRDAKKLKEDLAKMGVMIRHYSNKELKGYVRVSVGKPEQTDALMDCIDRLS